MSIAPRGMSINEAYRLYRSGNLLINRKYQRKLVWTLEEKERLIGSILKGYPIPLILLAERPQLDGSGKYEVIDGMQRLNAIFSFIENSFTFQEKFFDLDEFSFAKQKAEDKVFESVDSNLPRLSASECADIQDYQLAVTIYQAMEENDITDVFNRINSSGKHLSNQEKRQAGIISSFSELVRNISTQLRGDDSKKLLHLYDMPEISIDSRSSAQGYKIKAEETIWCKQGILTPRQLRDSEDEEMVADIVASILLGEPLPKSKEKLDELYNKTSKYFKQIEKNIANYSSQKIENRIITTFSILRETIEQYSNEKKCLVKTVNPGSNNPIPTAFYTIVMAFYDLVVNQELLPIDPNAIMNSLEDIQKKLKLSQRYTTIKDRKNNINQVKGLIQDYFAQKEPPVLGQGAELIFNLENSLRRSRIETNRYECKQGLLNLDDTRDINHDLLQRLIHTICGIANLGPEADGYIFIGVADKIKDAKRIKTLDRITPIEINERYIVGIDREAKVKQWNLEDYEKILLDTISNSELTEPLKRQVLGGFDFISYKDLSVIRITIPAQSEVSFVGNIAFTRQGSSTVKIEGKEILAINQLFSN
ncbi:MAG: DUF262 domain-containing protein [Crocosphaera sp.]|nr:DUF262 domain-containing protein [Crocosphaera sp.]